MVKNDGFMGPTVELGRIATISMLKMLVLIFYSYPAGTPFDLVMPLVCREIGCVPPIDPSLPCVCPVDLFGDMQPQPD